MFNIHRNTKPETSFISPLEGLENSELLLACDSNNLLMAATVYNLGFSPIPFEFTSKKVQNIAQYGFATYNILIPFHLTQIGNYRSVVSYEKDTKAEFGFSQYDHSSSEIQYAHKIVDNLGSPYYPDYNP
jgi:hypothetical protein